ncbi:MAG: PP2C family protein-serine/threonine phosphatase [Candidatus Peregrinibacteria bacterium]
MKFLRSTVTRKFVSFILLLAVGVLAGYFGLEYYGFAELPLMYLYAGLLFLLLIISVFFLLAFGLPLERVAREVKLLLTGQKYSRVSPSTIDEIGVFTYFFNEITHNLEKISKDILKNERLTSELGIASKIQRDVLPKSAPPVEGLDIIAKTTAAAEVGGDSFDFIKQGTNTFIYIGDVTGHGVPAGLVMMMVNTLIHVFSKHNYTPQQMLVETNKILLEKISGQRFMTLLMLRWDEEQKKMFWTGAGHEHLLVYRNETREVELLRGGGIALRMAPNIEHILKEQEIRELHTNDVVLLYTDGITEAKNPEGEMFTVGRLVEALRETGHKPSAESIFDAISEKFANFILDTPQEDDITMIIAKRVEEGHTKRTPVKLVISSVKKTNQQKKWSWDEGEGEDIRGGL